MDIDRKRWLYTAALTSIADDYESIETVWPDLRRLAEEQSIEFTEAELIAAFSDVVRNGDAKCYELDPRRDNLEGPVPFGVTRGGELWGYATKQGIQRVKELHDAE
jgi:hypothetical protein